MVNSLRNDFKMAGRESGVAPNKKGRGPSLSNFACGLLVTSAVALPGCAPFSATACDVVAPSGIKAVPVEAGKFLYIPGAPLYVKRDQYKTGVVFSDRPDFDQNLSTVFGQTTPQASGSNNFTIKLEDHTHFGRTGSHYEQNGGLDRIRGDVNNRNESARLLGLVDNEVIDTAIAASRTRDFVNNPNAVISISPCFASGWGNLQPTTQSPPRPGAGSNGSVTIIQRSTTIIEFKR